MSALPELSTVRIKREIGRVPWCVPAGSVGTIVHVYSDGLAYEVEFEDCAVETVEADDLEAA